MGASAQKHLWGLWSVEAGGSRVELWRACGVEEAGESGWLGGECSRTVISLDSDRQ